MKNLSVLLLSLLTAATVHAQTPVPSVASIGQIAEQIDELYTQMNLGQIQVESSSLVKEIQQEVRTSTDTTSANQSGGIHIRGLLLGLNLSGDNSSSSRIDHTQLVNGNPEQLARQESHAAKSAVKLQAKLNSILADHLVDLVHLKELAIEESAAAIQLASMSAQVPWAIVAQGNAKAQAAEFIGTYRVTRCLEVRHIRSIEDHQTKTDAAGSFNLLFLLGGSGSYNDSSEQKTVHYAYNDESCSTETATIKADEQSSPNAVDLSILDQLLTDWQTAAQRAQTYAAKAPVFPTWGSPYYN